MTRRDILTAVPVAFTADGGLDLDGSREILEYVAASGNEGAFVLGTTGEFPALSFEERGALTKLSLEVLSPAMRVVVHVGAPSLYEVLRLIEQARSLGAKEIAVITPYYLPSTDEALLDFFTAVSVASDGLDVYVYVYRKRTGNFVSVELMATLAGLPHIVGAKVSEEPLELIAEYRAAVPESFLLYTGADRELAAAAGSGAQGVVSGISSVLPKPFRALAAAADSGDADALAAAQADVDVVVSAIAGDMGRMKAAYSALGINGGTTRMAIQAPDAEAIAEIERVVSQYR
ncbi:4-hydroxy-tetrahydrodipicolinate synthase [Microbacteriaceae bacterium SG_E_30_P1]|uniref:4-hydroxy-tetrahydrodipicolinate synthase n=1 Tax=Antiquaquibacter oligotrophicus TaxID=2880260 RepID=A0ABT6KQ59_9MICO|nr:dihydrodipicolinate synthase family protein [Antiquaquibacter oligotrophicus]MDH6182098.1 4-hydroxy-tetrahydrodipicolinate synthase [Antiquaquibacter oligotrophicus]UDF12237.1 dihydrodipicolinate synthase family protein [Antiquaquibacter oligotrophicus]